MQHRETARQQRLQVAEEQLPVHRQAPRLDARWWRVGLRVADVTAHAQLLGLQGISHGAAPFAVFASRGCVAPRSAIRAAAAG